MLRQLLHDLALAALAHMQGRCWRPWKVATTVCLASRSRVCVAIAASCADRLAVGLPGKLAVRNVLAKLLVIR